MDDAEPLTAALSVGIVAYGVALVARIQETVQVVYRTGPLVRRPSRRPHGGTSDGGRVHEESPRLVNALEEGHHSATMSSFTPTEQTVIRRTGRHTERADGEE